MIKEAEGDPKPRIAYEERRVEYWPKSKYVDHDLDPIFEAAEKDRARPKDVHIGWWAVRQALEHNLWHAGFVMIELPFRYDGDLDPKTHLRKILSETNNLDSESFDNFRYGWYSRAKRKCDHLLLWNPETGLRERFLDFHTQALVLIDELQEANKL